MSTSPSPVADSSLGLPFSSKLEGEDQCNALSRCPEKETVKIVVFDNKEFITVCETFASINETPSVPVKSLCFSVIVH